MLHVVLTLMAKNGLKLRLDKCTFGAREIDYLGYSVSSKGIQPSKEHVQAILNYSVPRSPKQVQQFLGLVGFCKKFIPNFALISKPLSDLRKKRVTFSFGENELHAFENLIIV